MALLAGSVSAYHLQDGTVWLKKWDTFDAFDWGGTCMRLEEGTETLGGQTTTTQQNPRAGGLVLDGVMDDPPEGAEVTLAMKRKRADRMKTQLKRCRWILDQRMHCGDLDIWNKWEEITRYCMSKASERTISGTNFEDTNEEAMVSLSFQALDTNDIYRVFGEEGDPLNAMTVAVPLMFTEVAVCQKEKCPGCDDQEECVVVAVTETDAATSHLAVNLLGGDLDGWTDPPLALTAFGIFSATAVACLGEFVVVTSNGAAELIYSDDRGTTQVVIGVADVPDFTTNPPNYVDMIDQSFIIVTGDNGYIYGSYDGARTWEVLEAGGVTVDNLGRVMICRENPQVIYVLSSADDEVLKSENGGRTWAIVTATTSAATAMTGLWVASPNRVLVGTDIGELFETLDGGLTWTEQNELPGLTTKANTAITDIDGCGCDVVWLSAWDSVGGVSFAFRNVDGGSNGRWFIPEDNPTATEQYSAIACCGPNTAIAVGGTTTATSVELLME